MRRHEMLRPSQRARMIADQLQQQAMQPRVGASGGGMVAPMHWGEGFAQLGQALLARRADKRADRLDKEERDSAAIANEEMIRALAPNERPQRLDEATGQPVGPGATELLDVQTGRPMLSERGNLLARAIEGADPREAGDMLRSVTLQQAFAQPEAYTLGEGEARFVGGKKVAERPKSAEEKLTDDQREHAAAVERDGYTGTLQDWILEQRKAGAPSVSVNTKEEGEEAKAVGRGFGEMFMKTQEAGIEANNKIARLDRMEQLVGDLETGKLTPAATQVAGFAKSLGIDLDPNLGAKEAAISLASEMAMQNRNPAGGAGMPGSMSDSDREFLLQMTPNLAHTKAGRALIVETGRKLAERDREVARMAREYRRTHGKIDEGFFDVLEEHARTKPLFAATGVKISGEEDYNALPSGTIFIGPDNKRRVKP